MGSIYIFKSFIFVNGSGFRIEVPYIYDAKINGKRCT